MDLWKSIGCLYLNVSLLKQKDNIDGTHSKGTQRFSNSIRILRIFQTNFKSLTRENFPVSSNIKRMTELTKPTFSHWHFSFSHFSRVLFYFFFLHRFTLKPETLLNISETETHLSTGTARWW